MNVKLVLQLIPLLFLIKAAASSSSPSLAKPNCQPDCGNNVSIPYPFGIGKDCYHDPWYEITCSNQKPILTRFHLEVLKISLEDRSSYQEVTVNSPIASNCKGGSLWNSTNLVGSPFNFSEYNRFTVLGCENALLNSQQNGEILAGCISNCRNTNVKGCFGINCCQTSIPYGLYNYSVDTTTPEPTAANCTYAFLLDRSYLAASDFSALSLTSLVNQTEHAPLLLDWWMTKLTVDPAEDYNSGYYCYFRNDNIGVPIYVCYCDDIYEGNPYIPHGCKVAEACAQCKGNCYRGSGDIFVCDDNKQSTYDNKQSLKGIILGASIATGGSLLLLLGGFWLYKVTRKMRKTKRKEKFFENLLQQISSNRGTVVKTKIFTFKELKKATDNFNRNRILGQGGQGTVYKGMLIDGQIIAIKKPKLVDESQFEEFINEVVILSQLNHRNVLKLLGCCLQTDVPLLVYEFISNGNLFELIHDQNEEFPLSWEMRLQIASDVAGAVAYLHSSSMTPIYHRDIKSTNILLDDKYRAKVSDFGTSRSISIDQTHITTLVKGTFGYLDPEYFQSSQFTEKSDVYSFGVVLAELLTGQKPISSIRSQEEKSLATHFILSLQENRLFEIIDARVMKEGGKKEIMTVANLAKWCLNPNGKNRPTMTEVTMKLEGIRRSHTPLNCQENFEQDEFNAELMGPSDGASVSTSSHSNPSTGAFSLDFHPLL